MSKTKDELQRKLATKTREIEALVAAEQNLGDLNSMGGHRICSAANLCRGTDLQMAGAKVHPTASNPDSAINRLIAEREEIEEQIVALEVR
jgi:hypothetical protein